MQTQLSDTRRSMPGITPAQLERLERKILEKFQGNLHETLHEALTSTQDVGAVVEQPKEQQGSAKIKQPAPGGACADIWAALDKIAKSGTNPSLEAVRKMAKRRSWNAHTARVQFYRWRGFHGIRREATSEPTA